MVGGTWGADSPRREAVVQLLEFLLAVNRSAAGRRELTSWWNSEHLRDMR